MKIHLRVLFLLTGFPLLVIAQNLQVDGNLQINGDTAVGNSATKGGVNVTGTTGANAVPGIKVTGDGGVVFEGTFGQGSIPAIGSSASFLWYPKKAALRVSSSVPLLTEGWIGDYSTALGLNSRAPGFNAIATSGGFAIGPNSTATSEGTAIMSGATAFASGTAHGPYSVAMSGANTMGANSTAASYGSTVGANSTATSGGFALGSYTTAVGSGTFAQSYRSVVVGSENTNSTNYSWDSWVPNEPIFIVGNGSGNVNDPPEFRTSDALIILKNGDVIIPKRQGDISMGEFGN